MKCKKIIMIQATVDRFEENFAIISFPNGDSLSIHIDELPDNTTEGATLYFNPSLEPNSESPVPENQENLAKNILNQILKKN